jgi:diadenosine tetraphosphatase ApaH/serine/threonine PP2A family protein phosphatase
VQLSRNICNLKLFHVATDLLSFLDVDAQASVLLAVEVNWIVGAQDVFALLEPLYVGFLVQADTLVCLGDIVGYGPFPNECIELVRTRCSIVVRGNHDTGAVYVVDLGKFDADGRTAIEWTRSKLTPQNRKYLQGLSLINNSNDVTYVHASPGNPEKWTYVSTWQHAARVFPHFMTKMCCLGHTQVPSIVAANGMVNIYQKGDRHLIHVGSVGQPRDGNPSASFALLDTVRKTASIIRVKYDVATTAGAIRKAGLPEFLARRLEFGI